MKIETSFSMLVVGVCLGAQVCVGGTRRVSTAEQLYDALTSLNGSSTNTVEIEPGNYNVSAYEMYAGSPGTGLSYKYMPAHLKLSKLTIRGVSADPRAVVIFGDGTKVIIKMDAGVLQNVTVSNGYSNASESYGAGLSGPSGEVVGTSVCSNLVLTCCNNSSGNGGGGAVLGDCYAIESCKNSAMFGGGLAYVSKAYDCYIHDNIATASGGGTLNVSVRGGVVARNSANYYGGMSCNSAISSVGCMVVSNTASAYGGGAGCISSKAFQYFYDATFIGNSSMTSGGAGSRLVLSNCVVSCNRAGSYGGGISDSTAYNCSISNNLALTQGGGAYNCLLFDSDIVMNIVSNDYGATAYTADNLWAQGAGVRNGTATRCCLAGNAIPPCGASEQLGGAASDSELIDCRVVNNYAKVGGAINGGSATGCVISNNATQSGMYVVRSTLKLTNCDLYGVIMDSPGAMMNCVVTGGGLGANIGKDENVAVVGVFPAPQNSVLISNSQGTKIHATNCLFTSSVVTTLVSGNSGGQKLLSFVNCTIAGNQMKNTFSSMRNDPNVKTAELELVNCIFAENLNKEGTESREFQPADISDTNVTIRNCLILGGIPEGWTPKSSVGIIIEAPRFCKGKDVENPYALRYSSPARGKGEKMDWMDFATDVRRESKFPRLREGLVDLGCYQCWLNPDGLMLLLR